MSNWYTKIMSSVNRHHKDSNLLGIVSSPSQQQQNHHHHHQSSPGQSIPQSLKLTDYLRPVFQESYMIREYCLLAQIQQQLHGFESGSLTTASSETLNYSGQPKILTGVYVVPSAQSRYVWFGLLCVNNERSSVPSPWHGGVFRFYMKFPENYPSTGWPTITFLPISCVSHALSPSQFVTISTHPDINGTSGLFNLRSYVTSSTTSSHVPRTYKILRAVRKSFYKQFADVDINTCVNPSVAEMCARDHAEFLRNCAIDAGQSTQFLRETDKFLVQRFKADHNLILLGGGANVDATTGVLQQSADNSDNHHHNDDDDGDGGGSSKIPHQMWSSRQRQSSSSQQQPSKTLGLSFMSF